MRKLPSPCLRHRCGSGGGYAPATGPGCGPVVPAAPGSNPVNRVNPVKKPSLLMSSMFLLSKFGVASPRNLAIGLKIMIGQAVGHIGD
jgi:hypothetical protein